MRRLARRSQRGYDQVFKRMRIATYNILDGGQGRADPIGEVIEAQRPDIVALVEADDADVVGRLAGRLGMDSIHSAGNSHALALLSRWPIVETINHSPLHSALSKGLLEARVAEPHGAPWVIGVLHLHAHAAEADERRREQEIAVILDVFAVHRRAGTPHLLVGDFNSNAPTQQIDPGACKLSTRREWDENGGQIPRRVVERVLAEGYVDVFAAVDPQAAATTGTFSTQFPGQRVDYVFAWGIAPRQMGAAWVERDRLAQYASDHFPMGAQIEAASG